MKILPTINKLHVENYGKPNEYGEREIILRAEKFTGTTTPTSDKKFDYIPVVATIRFGYNEQEQREIAEEIAKRCNQHDKLTKALKNLVEQCEWIPKDTFTKTGLTAFKQALKQAQKQIK